MTAGEYSITPETYESIQNYVIGVYKENYPGGLIPVENVDEGVYIHKIPYFEEYDVSKGILDWDAEQKRADAKLQHLDVPIFGRQLKFAWTTRDLRRSGQDIIDAKNKAIINKFLDEIDYALWHGNKEGNVTLNDGLLSQATVVEDLNGSDSALVAAAGLIAGMRKMVTTMPVKYRSLPLVMLMDWHFYDLISEKYITTDVTVLEAFQKAYPGIHIIKNNEAVLDPSDEVGTEMRLMLFPQDINILRNVVAKEVSPVGPALVDLTGAVQQIWGKLFAPKVVKSDAVLYSEPITYADS